MIQPGSSGDVERLLIDVASRDRAHLLAVVLRNAGDLSLAEDAVQEAFSEALLAWRRDGVPRSPVAWLTTTARRRVIDRLRRESSRRFKHRLAAAQRPAADVDRVEDPFEGVPLDDELRLIFGCCHPDLTETSQLALTLRLVIGLRSDQVAALLLSTSDATARRIRRARARLRGDPATLRIPPDWALRTRIPAANRVLYLTFTSDYRFDHHAPSLERRVDLATEAVRLGRVMADTFADPESRGLLGLMLLVDARRETRVDNSGNRVLLADQDPRNWDHDSIAEARTQLDLAAQTNSAGTFQFQAAIQLVHIDHHPIDVTGWERIDRLYTALRQLDDSPVIAVNHAVAIGKTQGPSAALDLLRTVEGALDTYHLLHSTRAHLLADMGRTDEAVAAYREALLHCTSSADQRFLIDRVEELDPQTHQT